MQQKSDLKPKMQMRIPLYRNFNSSSSFLLRREKQDSICNARVYDDGVF